MIQQTKDYDVTWAQFEVCNSDPRDAFEKMCRWLFNEFFFEGKALLHSNPNNPGIEVVPVMHAESNKLISFQAKYFTDMSYEQILHSAKMAVKYYAGQLDIIYLYCNKDVTTTSKGYQGIETYLRANGIEIKPITNQTILEQVMKKETIAWHYFNHTSLSKSWFEKHIKNSLASLGPRYNEDFNVNTHTEELFNYFLCNKETVYLINTRKKEIIDDYQKNKWKYRKYGNLCSKIISEIKAIEDVSQRTINQCLGWASRVKEGCKAELDQLSVKIAEKKAAYAKAMTDGDRHLIDEVANEIDELNYLYELPDSIAPTQQESKLIEEQVLIIKGEAGVGKSQLFAVAAKKSIEEERPVIFVLGTYYLKNESVCIQTPEILGLNLSMDAVLHELEGLGVQQNGFAYVFIDAINETTYKSIWYVGLWSLIDKMQNYPHIKLVISVRNGYEKIVFDDTVLKKLSDGNIVCLEHTGFRNESVEATKTFLDHYGIPFLPSYFLQEEMTNPLFLTLFCKNYSGENFDMLTLFERLMERADSEAQKTIGIAEPLNVLFDLVEEIVEMCLQNGTYTIAQKELFKLEFWNVYGLSAKKLEYVASLVKSGFLITMASEYTESYSFGYNLLQDFVCAKKIVNDYPEKEKLVAYICDVLLKIEEGNITNYHNIDVFVVICALYADKCHTELFSEIEKSVTDEWDKADIVERYLSSFLWRKASSVSEQKFLDFINMYPVDRNLVLRILIENSAKEHHPLNAIFLHKVLMNKELVKRDALWTTYINNLAYPDERLFQLITFFDEGNLLDGLSEANTELLLILFTWIFSSSNRLLRDKASKAAIELLKRNFQLCKKLLILFEDVNDPYVLQRLYGVVFGACLKREENEKDVFKNLAKYIYDKIFLQEYVYPDVLLRDYARMLLERWRYENPDESDFIDINKITPPYASIEIPTVERQEYYESGARSGFNMIARSMQINHSECPGLYGDFGRYTFQAALSDFEGVDIVNLYHYTMQFIRDELGYDDDLLGSYDCMPRHYSYNRHETRKIERVGKKYQWIALYNVISRVSDKNLIKKWEMEPSTYEGGWEPYIRDFDPTLNKNSWKEAESPIINLPESGDEFLDTSDGVSISEIREWKNSKPKFFKQIPEKLRLEDDEGNEWMLLHLYEGKENKIHELDMSSIGFTKGSQKIWLIMNGFFMKPEHFEALRTHMGMIASKDSFSPEGKSVYQLYNREYAWSSGYQNMFREQWIDYEIETGKYRIEKEVLEFPDYENLQFTEEGKLIIPMVEKEFERRIPEETLHLEAMPAYSRVLWEAEYDASQVETTSFDIPCGDIINYLELEQKQVDGHYYSKDGTLVCFDANTVGLFDGLLIRKEFLDKYLVEKNVKLCWDCFGEKQYFQGDLNQEWSRWHGIYHYDNGEIHGELQQKDFIE